MYNEDGNFDRVISYGLCMLYREQLYQHKVVHNQGESKQRKLFESPIYINNILGMPSVPFDPDMN
jgi:hypothetical protein